MVKTRKAKVLLLDLWRVNNASGGTEKVFFEMANNLERLGYEVFCVAYDVAEGAPLFEIAKGVNYKNLAETLRGDNKSKSIKRISHILDKAIILGRSYYRNFITYLPSFDKPIRKIKQYLIKAGKGRLINEYIKEVSPDLIISFQPEATDIIFGRGKPKQKVITMFHMNPSTQFAQDKELFNKSLRKSAVIQTLRPEFRDELISKIGFQNVVYIPNTVAQHSMHANLDSKVITFLGRFDKVQKRPHLLVEAFSEIASSYPDWVLKLYGEFDLDEEYTDSIKKIIKDKSLEKKILLMGVTKKPLLSLSESSIFVFPSSSEGFGLALAEAMSLGIACIGCKGCDSVDGLLIDHHNGILVEPNSSSIAFAIEELIRDGSLRKKLGGQAKIAVEEFKPERVWNMWNQLITETIEKI